MPEVRGTQTIRRAVRLLKQFTDSTPEWTLAGLAEALELNKTTAYRALAALEEEGLVRRVPGKEAFRLGPEVIVLGSVALRASDLRSVSRPELEALAKDTGEMAMLEVPVAGHQMLIIDEFQGPGLLGTTVEIGTRWPMHATSTGKAYLAAMESWAETVEEGDWELPGSLSGVGPETVTEIAELRSELAEIRRRGYAVAVDELQEGYAAVGAAVVNHEGRAVGAVSVGGPAGRFTEDRIPTLGSRTQVAVERISRTLGARVGT